MIRCYLALGSNLGTPTRQLHQAIATLRCFPKTHVIDVANFYHNKAWGRRTQPNFVNTVVAINTYLTPNELLKKCLALEKKQGRYRLVKWGARTLDIDILLYGTQLISTPTLVIPHPRMHERDFVLIPLKTIRISD
jgi:2-amino-4-hydroxy-6-hydroxymethyldihydropteridine diphosphokinase